jgi:predicted phosphohydrolase
MAFYLGAEKDQDVEVLACHGLPQQPENAVRVVTVSDTHLLHRSLTVPDGDILIHAGDLSYEESRSLDAEAFERYCVAHERPSTKAFLKWFCASGLGLADALKWLGSVGSFQHRVLIGGNHDHILERLGPKRARRLCKAFGVTYLFTEYEPAKLRLKSGALLSVWGSGVSVAAGLSATRAVKSGNAAFQLSSDQEALFKQQTAFLKKEQLDILVTHAPPMGGFQQQSDQFKAIGELVTRLRPSLYVCGHAHKKTDPLQDICARMGDGTLAVNAACLGVWNHLHGAPIVIDRAFDRRRAV